MKEQNENRALVIYLELKFFIVSSREEHGTTFTENAYISKCSNDENT